MTIYNCSVVVASCGRLAEEGSIVNACIKPRLLSHVTYLRSAGKVSESVFSSSDSMDRNFWLV